MNKIQQSLVITICVLITIVMAVSYKQNKIIKPKVNSNRIIKSTYNIEYNLFNVLYIENNDTIGLDDIYPIELDSLIKKLNQ